MVAHSLRRACRRIRRSTAVLVVIGDGQADVLGDAVGDASVGRSAARRGASRCWRARSAHGGGATRVLIHDAARPFVPAAVIDRLLAALDDAEGARAGAAGRRHAGTRRRRRWASRRPRRRCTASRRRRRFDFDAILRARIAPGRRARRRPTMRRWCAALGDDGRDGAGRSRCSTRSPTPPISPPPRRGCALAMSRSATGFDVHRLEAGEELWLGGVLIPHDKGLSGHSDADVALHAHHRCAARHDRRGRHRHAFPAERPAVAAARRRTSSCTTPPR